MRRKRVWAMLMSLVLTFSGMPAIALADNSDETEEIIDYGTPGEDYVEGEVIACITTSNDGISLQSLGAYSMEPVMDVTVQEDEGISTQSENNETSAEEKTLVLVTGGDTASMIADLEADPSVEFAEPNYIVKMTEEIGQEPTDPLYEYQWGLKNQFTNEAASADMNAVGAWSSMGADTTTPVVAVIDSGVDYTHPDLEDVMWMDGENYPELTGLGGGTYGVNYSRVPGESTSDPMDTTIGHGTHCAGVVAAQWDNGEGGAGVAQNCQIMAVKFLDQNGRATNADILRCFNYVQTAKKAGVNVVATNNSWGPNDYYERNLLSVSTAVTSLGNCGVVSCFSAGNDDVDRDLNVGAAIISPYAVMVGAHDSQGYRATFSNYGQRMVDVFAPGTQILSTTSLQDTVMQMPPQYLPQIQDRQDSYFYENFDGDTSKVGLRLLRLDGDGNEIAEESEESMTETLESSESEESAANAETAEIETLLETEQSKKDSETSADTAETVPAEEVIEVEQPQTAETVQAEQAQTVAKTTEVVQAQVVDAEEMDAAKNDAAIAVKLSEMDESQSCTGFRGNARALSLAEIHAGEGFCVEITVDISDILNDIEDSDPIYFAAEISMGNVIDNNSLIVMQICQDGVWKNIYTNSENEIPLYAYVADQGWVLLSGKCEATGLDALGDISADGKVKFRIGTYFPISKEDTNAVFRIDEFGIGKTASNYFYSDGTSMATPMVTGLAALAYSKASGDSDAEKALDVVSRIKGGVNREKAQESVSGGIVDAEAVMSDDDLARVPVVDTLTLSGNKTAVIEGHYFGDSGSVTIGGISVSEVEEWTSERITVTLPEGIEGLQEVVVTRLDGTWGHKYLTLSADTYNYTDLNAPQLDISSEQGYSLTSADVVPEGMAAAGNTIMLVGYLAEMDQRVIEIYDTTTGIWELAPLPSDTMKIIGRFGGMAGAKDRIYMLYKNSDDKAYLGVYDTLEKAWTNHSAEEIPSGASLVVYQDKLLAVGGADSDGKAIDNVSIIDPKTGEIVEILEALQLPSPQIDPLVYASGNMLAITQGRANESKSYGNVSVYDGEKWVEDSKEFFTWDNLDFDGNQTLSFATGATDTGLIVAGPVSDNAGKNMADTWIFDQTDGWSKDTTRLFSQRKTTQVIGVSLGDQFYVLGYNADGVNPMIFRSTTISHTDPAKNPEETTSDPDPVTATVKSGKVDKGTTVELRCATSYADIYYTMDDGSVSYENAVKYTTPLEINENTVIRAWSQIEGDPEPRKSSVNTFRWEVKGLEIGDQYEPNESIETATAMSFPAVVSATLHAAKDVDVYQFELTNKENLSLTLTSPADAMYKLTLYDADKKELKTAEYKESSQNIRYTEASSGIYYAEVKSLDDSYSDKNTYQLNLTREMNEEEISKLDLSEQNLITALADEVNSSIAREGGANGGGSNIGSLAYYSGWAGPVSEEQDPYDGSAYTADTIDEKYQYKDLSEEALYHVQNALILPAGSRETYISNVKNAIYSYGAVSARVYWATSYATSDSKNLFIDDINTPLASKEDGGGHIITVVGWDDGYSKDNFTGNPNYVEANYPDQELTKPENDGAFICKNSWGTESGGTEIGEEGYFYVSYEDAIMCLVNGFIFMADELPDNYNHQYYNDIKGCVTSYQNYGAISTSEVFKNESNQAELLRAVSFQTEAANMRYEIAVRQGNTLKKVAEGKKKYAGFYTERLSQSLLVEAGSEFEVIVLMENEEGGPASIGITMNYPGEVSGVEAMAGKAYEYIPDGTNTKREDIGLHGYYPCIRAYTYDVEDTGYQTTTLSEANLGAMVMDAQTIENVTDDYISTASVSEVTQYEAAPSGYNPMMDKVEEANKAEAPEGNLPDQFDLRTTKTLTAVRDQKRLGSCWAFAATASMESSIARNGGAAVTYPQSLTLSDSQLSVLLDTENTEVAVKLTAMLNGAAHVSSEKIFWSVTGDLDSVKLNQTSSMNGEETAVLTAVKPGIVTVTAASDADMTMTASCKVIITSQGVETLSLIPSEMTLKTGETGQLRAVAGPENAIDKTVLYESDHPEIASVDENGKVTALSEGNAVITALAGNVSATANVTVTGKEEKPEDTKQPEDTKETKPADTKPADTLPEDTKPADTKPNTSTAVSNTANKTIATSASNAADKSTSTANSVATGDQTPVILLMLVGLGAAGIAGVIIRKKRKHH